MADTLPHKHTLFASAARLDTVHETLAAKWDLHKYTFNTGIKTPKTRLDMSRVYW